MRTLDIISFVLLVIGGLNWALVGLFNFDLVRAIFGDFTLLTRLVYVLVGLAAIYLVASWRGMVQRAHDAAVRNYQHPHPTH